MFAHFAYLVVLLEILIVKLHAKTVCAVELTAVYVVAFNRAIHNFYYKLGLVRCYSLKNRHANSMMDLIEVSRKIVVGHSEPHFQHNSQSITKNSQMFIEMQLTLTDST